MNIASLVIRAKPEWRSRVEHELRLMSGVEVAYSVEDGPFIVTVEDTPAYAAIDAMTDIHRLPGVIAVSLSYHYSDDFLEHA